MTWDASALYHTAILSVIINIITYCIALDNIDTDEVG